MTARTTARGENPPVTRDRGYLINGRMVWFSQFKMSELEQAACSDRDDLSSYRTETLLPGDWKKDGQFSGLAVAEILAYHFLRKADVAVDTSEAIAWRYGKALLWHAFADHAGVCELSGTKVGVARAIGSVKRNPSAAGLLIGLSLFDVDPPAMIDLTAGAAQMMEGLARPLFRVGLECQDSKTAVTLPIPLLGHPRRRGRGFIQHNLLAR